MMFIDCPFHTTMDVVASYASFQVGGRVIAKKGEITLNIEQKYAEIKYLQYLHLPWLTMMEPEDYD